MCTILSIVNVHVASSFNLKMIEHTLFAWMELQETPHVSLFGDLPESPIPVSPRLDFHFNDFVIFD